ncbi:DUF397 domain-containing protein [Streptomyces sp. NPDC002588]
MEIALRAGHVLARDSKTRVTAVVHFTGVAWTDFLRALRGELKDS